MKKKASPSVGITSASGGRGVSGLGSSSRQKQTAMQCPLHAEQSNFLKDFSNILSVDAVDRPIAQGLGGVMTPPEHCKEEFG